MSFMSKVFEPGKDKKYHPINQDKYVGNGDIIIRSSWEKQFARWCDTNPSVIQWASEPFHIEYTSPITKKKRRYYPDFLIKVKDKDGKEAMYLIEIKPLKEVSTPKNRANKSEKVKIHEATTFITNRAKWTAADLYCKKHGMVFRIITERELFNKC